MHPRATCSSLTQIVTAVKFGCLACVETLGDATHASAAGAAEGPLGAAPRHNRYFNTSPLAPRRQHRVPQAEEEDDHRARDAETKPRAALGAHALQRRHRRVQGTSSIS